MKIYYSLITVLLIGSSAMSNEVEPLALLDVDLASLGELQVYTANRTMTNIEEAPSVVTIIDQSEIKRRGYRTLHDALSRVPGFFSGVVGQSQEVISNRGFIQGGNRSYLLLIDGHSQNTVTGGSSNAHIFPTMDFVKRIEIIRGPGSTLWGNSAIAGIIHIITKSGSDIDTKDNEYGSADITLDYELEQKRQVQSLQYGKVFEEGSMMISLTRFDSDADASDIYKPNNGIELLNKDLEPGWTSSSYSAWDFKPSHDLYFKGDYKDFSLYLREADMTTSFPWFQSYEGDGKGDWTMKRQYVDFRYNPKLSRNISLEVRAFYNNFQEIDTATLSPSQQVIRGYKDRYLSYEEKTMGTEAILKYKNDSNSVLVGIYYEKRDWDKKDQRVTTVYTNKKETNSAFFIEDTYSGIEDWLFTLGGRIDSNSVREKENIFLPRVAVLYRTSEKTTLKYAYNTGYSRPANDLDNISLKPEGSQTHDLQFSYWADDATASITLFHNTITDNIVWEGAPVNGVVNGDDIVAKGIEVEGSYKVNQALQIYANYAYSESKYDEVKDWSDSMDKDGRVAGVPNHTYNLGADYNFFQNYDLNINFRGWGDAVTRWTWNEDDGHEKFGHEYFVDLSLYASEIATIKDLEGNIYIKNLLNNNNPYPDAVEGGYVEGPHDRLIGLKVTYRF